MQRTLSNVDIEFNDVSKRYLIDSNRSTLPSSGNTLARGIDRLRSKTEAFWAVRNVSFDVRRGEALGIIGHNGAGKSTILKLLSNITAPTSGSITIRGRLSALIEVGSGFHPELSGRENIFLSGSILGMRRREIATKLDSIVEFAGIRQFVDTPVKRYSSGMYVRLGFAIAAHLEPDILLLDEVLAVGDSAFQAKCLLRIKDLEAAGTTIVFISHDLLAVERVCQRAILMERGQIAAEGRVRQVVDHYHNSVATIDSSLAKLGAQRDWSNLESAPGDEVVRLRSARIRTPNGETASIFTLRNSVGIEVAYDVLEPGHMLVPNFHFSNQDGAQLFAIQDVGPEWHRRARPVGRYISTAWLPADLLTEGSVSVNIGVSSHLPKVLVHAWANNVVAFHMTDPLEQSVTRGDYTGSFPGVVRPLVNWTTVWESA